MSRCTVFTRTIVSSENELRATGVQLRKALCYVPIICVVAQRATFFQRQRRQKSDKLCLSMTAMLDGDAPVVQRDHWRRQKAGAGWHANVAV